MTRARDVSRLITTPPSIYATDSEASAGYLTLSSASSTYQSISSQPTIFRNLVINGDFSIWQRGTSFTDLSAGNFYGPDRFGFNRTGDVAGLTVSRSTDAPTGFNYSVKNQRTASNTNTAALAIYYSAESLDSKRFAGKNFTFSFYAKAGANYSGGVLSYTIYSGTGTDQRVYSFTGSASPLSSQANLTTSWQRFSASATFASNINQVGFTFAWTPTGTAGADDSVYITGVQLEEGFKETSFEFRPSQIELSLCQRYYEKSFPLSTTPANGIYTNHYLAQNVYDDRWAHTVPWISFKVAKRVTPSMIFYGDAAKWQRYNSNETWTTFSTVDMGSLIRGSSLNVNGFGPQLHNGGAQGTTGENYLFRGDWAAVSEL
jgi:hypothetical protein